MSSRILRDASPLRPGRSIWNDFARHQRGVRAVRRASEPRVAGWLDAQALETLYLSAVTIAELGFGFLSVPAGRRRDRLNEDIEGRILPMFAGRVPAFDLPASRACANLMAKARSDGRMLAVSDSYIAATAAANRTMVATRDTAPFEAAGLETVDPWSA